MRSNPRTGRPRTQPRRLSDAVADLRARAGDRCGLCGKFFTHGALTYYGPRFGALAVSCAGCVTELRDVFGGGLFSATTKGREG